MSRGEEHEDRDTCPHPEHGEPALPDTMDSVHARCQDAARDSFERAEERVVRAAAYATRKGAFVVGYYAEGYLRAYFIHSLN